MMPSRRQSRWKARTLGADAGVVEPGGDAPRLVDLAVRVLQEVRLRAVQDALLPAADRRGVAAGLHALAAGLRAEERDGRVVDEGVERADRVAAAADARDDEVRQAPGLLEDLRAGLVADHALEVADHLTT